MPNSWEMEPTVADRPEGRTPEAFTGSETGADSRSSSPTDEIAPSEWMTAKLGPIAEAFFDKLLRLTLLTPHAAQRFLEENRDQLDTYCTADLLADALISAELLTQYQYE